MYKRQILLVLDEIQAGVGRTGKFFSIDNWNVVPDIICTGKSLAAGMPLSAVIARKDIMDKLPSSSIGGTYVGNPVACRAASEVIDIIEDEHLLDRAVALGKLIRTHWDSWKEKYEIMPSLVGSEMCIRDRPSYYHHRDGQPQEARSVGWTALHVRSRGKCPGFDQYWYKQRSWISAMRWRERQPSP